jgi:hypothetical protein
LGRAAEHPVDDDGNLRPLDFDVEIIFADAIVTGVCSLARQAAFSASRRAI